MTRFVPRRRSLVAIALIVAAASACSDTGVTNPTGSITAGLSEVPSNDSATTNPAPPTGSGFFHGTVLGPALPGSGNDSLTTAPRIAGVQITIYPLIASTSNGLEHGPAAGSTTTDANGLWQLPTLPAGDYVVTFVPTEASGYHGVYAFGPLRSNSGNFAWWIVLSKK